MRCVWTSVLATSTVCASTRRARPCSTGVTLYFLNSPSIPLAFFATTPRLCSWALATSSFTSPATTPKLSDLRRVSSSSALCSSALVGMQPRCRQVPPSLGSFSTTATLSPSRSEEHTSELQSLAYLVCRLLLEKKKKKQK